MKARLLKGNLYLGLLILVSAVIILARGSSFMQTWFYIFAWWPFILILDSWNYRRSGVSPLFKTAHTFFFMLFVSIGVWLIFELFNFRLQNWSYHGLPVEAWQRWLGYSLAFSSVIPAIYELSELFRRVRVTGNLNVFSLKNTPTFRNLCMALGAICLILPMLWPQAFFPLIWLGFFFLLEPINHRLGNPCFLKELAEKDWKRFWSWVLAGLSAGFAWELFNFWAGSHWEYHLPYLDFGRVFQMPVFGYTGFMPFALEVCVLYTLFRNVFARYFKGQILRQIVGIVILSILYLGVYFLIDLFSVVS
jgi:hypothetical protein